MSQNNKKEYKDISDVIDEEISMEDINAYKQEGFIASLPYWLKALFIKYWFFGAMCFFVLMGIIGMVGENAAIFAGTLSGAIFDIVVYNILIMMESDKNESRHFIMFKSKKVYSVFINMAYNIVLFLLAMYICSAIVSTYEDPVKNWFLQEPLSQGLVLFVLDTAFISIKNLCVHIYKKSKNRGI